MLLSIYYQNVRGLRTKSKKFLCNSSSFDYKVIVLTETCTHQLDCSNNIECICVKITINSKCNLFQYTACIPPNSNDDIYKQHVEAIQKIPAKQTDTTIILGYFNISNSEWMFDCDDSNVLVPTVIKPNFAAEFINQILGCGFIQVNSIGNQDGKLFDLIFTNDYSNYDIVSPKPLSKIDNYHPPLMLNME